LPRVALRAAALVAAASLAWFYYAAASAHARTVNTSKARGDQSAYLGEAQLVYRNWTGANSPPILQPRNRMPLYPAFLAALYDPAWSNDEFFVHAKTQSIILSLVLLIAVAAVAWRNLPPLLAVNLVLVIMFGSFVFRAGYVQSELLFDTLNFATFVVMWKLLGASSARSSVALGAAAGLLAALAHLTKAAMLPLVAICLLAYIGTEWIPRFGASGRVRWPGRLAAGLSLAVVFLAVLSPYLANSKRMHGQYFYNLNTSALIWYDNYPLASVAIMNYGPDGWPRGPVELRPGPMRYWREHSVTEIAARFGHGLLDMLTGSYRTFWYLKFVIIYLALALLLVASAWRAFLDLVARHRSLAAFLILYAAVYLPAIAFYEPISGTGTTRFLMAHVTPLMFACSALFAAEPFRRPSWRVAGVDITATHVHVAVLASIALDITFWVWPRVMTTYGGF
jgi:hypothetical protein